METAQRSRSVLLPPTDTAKRLNLSTSCLAKWRLIGHGPEFLKIGGRVFYEEGALESWIASCRRRSTSDCGEAA